MLLFRILVAAVLLLLVIFIYLRWNTTRVRQEWITIPLKRLPVAFDGYRIAHLSDLHLEMNFVAEAVVQKWIEEVNPDLIVITGDCAETLHGVRRARTYLAALEAPDGIYAIFGNHEYHGSRKSRAALERMYQELGIELLRNQSVTIRRAGQMLQLVGLDDYCTCHENVELAYSDCRAEQFTVLLCHDPNIALELPEHSADYALAGHLHGGQLNFPGIFKLHPMGVLPRLGIVAGLHNIHGTKWYISRGLGQVGLPFRFRAFPEVTLHELRVDQ
ncbi:MAG: hypothetical protein JWN30_1839 [Bacilli bacterium]|nr:hypothetical protein [Bacilli bacterium]